MEGRADDRETGVRWNEWDPGTLARAAAEGKLIFLDIGAAWCHWCHVLDRTSLSDPRVVRILNEEYVSVRVDTDRRPDINERYNQGGWPTVAVLLPDGRLLTGATYLPPDALAGLLVKCREFYLRDRERIDGYLAEEAAQGGEAGEVRGSAPEAPGPEDLPMVKQAVLSAYDPEFPGFFLQPKFPVAEILAFLRDAWNVEGNAEVGDIFLKVLRTMGASGVFDPVEGGFFRYATRRDWTVPHYEKMLSDNAELLALYAAAYERTKEAAFAATGRDILRFLFAKLYDPATGAFFGSQDADETYYPLPAEERARRFPPSVDRTIFSEYNGRTVSALVAAHRAFGAPAGADAGGDSLLARAERLAGFLRGSLWRNEEGQARFLEREGVAEDPPTGLLSDHAAAAAAYLDLYDETGKGDYLRFAEEALSFAVGHLYREEAAGFVDRRPAAGDFGQLSAGLYPFAANAQAASALMRCARAGARRDLFEIAVRTLCGLSAEFDRRGAFGAPYGSALLLYRSGGFERQ
jgi:uncharacterized protein YyaL (SSP411 family)